MAQLSKTDFYSKWQNLFLNNSAGLITEARMREFTLDIQDSFVSEVSFKVPNLPTGVSWVLLPTTNIEGNTYSFSSSKINVNGIVIDIPEGNFEVPYASDNMHRLDAIVVDYNAAQPVYLRLAGSEVLSNANALRPPIGSNYLFVQDADIKDGSIEETTFDLVKQIRINNGQILNPNVAGIVDINLLPVSDTYSNIAALKNANGLTAGTFYRITDNQTIHTIPNSVALNVHGTTYESAATWTKDLSEGIEELILLAVTNNSFAPVVYSPTFPTDIIHFDFNNILCEDGVTPRKGKIIYRKDTVKNLECFYDWRKVKFRRYKLNPPAWSAGTTYARGISCLGSDGFVYFSKIANNINNNPASIGGGIGAGANHSSLVDNPIWERAFVNDSTFDLYFGTKTGKINVGLGDINTNSADFKDFFTFNTKVIGEIGFITGISIGSHTTYNNIIFRANYLASWYGNTNYGETVSNNTFGKGCSDMTFIGWNNTGNVFGENCSGNIIQGIFYSNVIGSGLNNNLFLLCTGEYLWGTNNNNFSGDFHNNIFANETQFNIISGTIWGNTFNYQMTCCEITTQAVNNTIRSGFRDNVCKKIQGCTIGGNAQQNVMVGGQFAGGLINATIGDNFMWNNLNYVNGATIGNNVQYNNILFNQAGLNFPDNFKWNKINGLIAANTYFAAGASKNTFNNDFGGGTAAIPLALNNCVFNKPVSGLQFANTGVVLTGIISNVSITSKTLPVSLSNETIAYTSPDGSIWINGVDNSGHLQPEKIV